MSNNKFLTCTAIAYVNSVPHMGHALEYIEADAIARYKRLMGHDTFFLTGTDEYGVKNYQTAKEQGIATQELVDKNAKTFIELKDLLNLTNDDFIRTSDVDRHWPSCQKLWKKLVEAGDIYEKDYEGLYCSGCERFMVESDLVDGKCPNHNRAPELLKERNYFFKLSKYSDKIVNLVESDQVRIYPEFRKNEFLNMAREGLHDVSFSRPKEVLPWGVDVPGDPEQVMYVWCDALTNYISALDYANNGEKFKQYWPCDLHVIGKDIVRFHAGIWIGMLLSAGIELPKGILVHGFLTRNGEKMSKSLGNVLSPHDVVEKYGSDALRYYLLREIPVGRDGDYNDDLFLERYNSDLANNLGNLVNRVHTLIRRNEIKDFAFDQRFEERVLETWKKYQADMDKFNLHEAVFHVWRLIDFANKTMEETKPWSLVRENPEEAKLVLCGLLELIRHVSIMISPIVPKASRRIREMIGLHPEIDIEGEKGWNSLENEWKTLGEGTIMFPRIEKEG